MGLVIKKTVQVLKLVASQEHCTLKTLCEATGSKKSALCQMLRSMVETNLLLRDSRGEYHIGSLFSDLSGERDEKLRRQKLIESIAVDLNTSSGASVTVATIRDSKYRRLFSCCSFRVTRLTPTAPDEEHFYGNATGRVLLANAPAALRLKIIDNLGLPSQEEWPEAAADQESLLAELEQIRRRNYAEVYRGEGRSYYIACAVPKETPESMPLAIGLGGSGADKTKKEKFLELLHTAAQRFE